MEKVGDGKSFDLNRNLADVKRNQFDFEMRYGILEKLHLHYEIIDNIHTGSALEQNSESNWNRIKRKKILLIL